MSKQTVTVTWEADTDRDSKTGRFVRQFREFEVTATVTPYHPPVIRLDPDDSCDAEGGEVEDLEVEENLYERRGRKLVCVETVPVADSILDELGLASYVDDRLREAARADDREVVRCGGRRYRDPDDARDAEIDRLDDLRWEARHGSD